MDTITAVSLTIAPPATTVPAIPVQAAHDHEVIAMWLHGRSAHTARAYEADARAFLVFAGTPIALVTVRDVQAYGTSLDGLSSATVARRLSAVKSLLAFAHRLGYVAFDVGAPVRLPSVKNTLAERIMDRSAVLDMLAGEKNQRNKALLSLIYYAGLRISEAAALCWRDVQARDDAGQITVFGKGGKTRAVLLTTKVFAMIEALGRGEPDEPVFASRKGAGPMDESAVHRVVKAAAARVGLSGDVSAHWLRHAHASHALDAGAPVHLVASTLGHSNIATTGRYLHARPNDSSARYLGGC